MLCYCTEHHILIQKILLHFQMDEWKCLSCCVKFTDETSFLLHIASHEVSNVNRCHLCVTAFKSAADICMHMVKYHKLYLTTGTKTDEDDTVVDSDQVSTARGGQLQSHIYNYLICVCLK